MPRDTDEKVGYFLNNIMIGPFFFKETVPLFLVRVRFDNEFYPVALSAKLGDI